MPGTNGAGSLAVSNPQLANYPPLTASALHAKLTQSAYKEPVRVASTASIANLSSVLLTNFDGAGQGVTLGLNDRVLVKDTASPDGVAGLSGKYNGWYFVASITGTAGALVRDLDADVDPKVNSGDQCFISEGTLAGKTYALTTANPITLGTTVLTFSATANGSNATTGAPGLVQLAQGLGGTGSTAAAPVLALGAGLQTGVLPAANMDPAFNADIQVVQDAGTMVAGSLVVSSGITIRAGSKVLVTRNNPDATAAHWGKLSSGTLVVGGPGVGSVTVTSSNVADTSSVSLTIFG
jgi:hypothetical protein